MQILYKLFCNALVVWEVMLYLECIDYVDAELTQSIRSKFPIYSFCPYILKINIRIDIMGQKKALQFLDCRASIF